MENQTRIVMPSINMLPMEDVVEVLEGVVVARDTNNVGGIASNLIAIGTTNDRNTVRNAENLGNRPAEEYLTIDVDPSEEIKALTESHRTEVAGLRLELYRLYEILNKQLGATYKPESGYLEDFIETISVSTTATVVNAGSFIAEIRPEQSDFAIAKEYIVIDDGLNQYVAQIASISNQVYILEGSISSAIREVTIYKIKGEMLKNTYSFSNTTKDTLSEYTHSVLLGDYADDITTDIGHGTATNIKLRSNMFAIDGDREKAVIDSVRAYITRNALNSTAELSCKIYLIESYEDNKPVKRLIGTSITQEIFSSDWITFKITNNGQPLEVYKNQEILVAFECNSDNAYQIKMGIGQGVDLHTNRSIFTRTLATNEYTKVESNYDILLGINFNGYIAETTLAYQNGLYTSKTFVNEREKNCLAQLQLNFKNINTAIVQSYTPVDGFAGFVVNKQILGTGKMVVGNNVATLNRININTIFTDEHIAVYPGDEVYFIPVKAQIVAHSELFQYHVVDQVVEMAPVRVTGDYLIFECELPEHVKHFEVQVAYEDMSNARAAALDSIAVSLI